ncbi:hypothetical protein [Vibrio rotiferianus]|uniref:hypothetical protein n=1 Tax=Vibrio rotiferianus TaxID=190895 RepID=UPI0005EF678E|nr:hypothetical protein [Vibrio rotiferianus]
MDRFEQLISRFYQEFVYTKEDLRYDYMAEIRDFDLSQWEAPKRAARLSAAVKNYKTSEMLVFTLLICQERRIDVTPLVIKRLNKAFFDRTGSQKDIVALFGESGRIHRSSDAHPDRIQMIVELYKAKAQRHWQQCLFDIESIKLEYNNAVTADQVSRIPRRDLKK